MPTTPQIDAGAAVLVPQPYNSSTSKMGADAQADLLAHLRKYLNATKRSGHYTQLADTINAQVGRKAAQLQAVLQNVSDEGHKVAQLKGELDYATNDTISSELEFALAVMYESSGNNNAFATSESLVAAKIRAAECMRPSERELTKF